MDITRNIRVNAALVLALAAAAAPGLSMQAARAGDVTPPVPFDYTTQSFVGPGALSGVLGRTAVNEAAGSDNTQANVAAVAVGAGVSAARARVTAVTNSNQSGIAGMNSASIGPGAFAHASGLISINQTSGHGNVQANSAVVALAPNVEVAADSMLAATTSNAGPTGTAAGATRSRQSASVATSAFSGARGLVQVNQSAGSGNATANTFALSVQTGAQP